MHRWLPPGSEDQTKLAVATALPPTLFPQAAGSLSIRLGEKTSFLPRPLPKVCGVPRVGFKVRNSLRRLGSGVCFSRIGEKLVSQGGRPHRRRRRRGDAGLLGDGHLGMEASLFQFQPLVPRPSRLEPSPLRSSPARSAPPAPLLLSRHWLPVISVGGPRRRGRPSPHHAAIGGAGEPRGRLSGRGRGRAGADE